MWNNGVVLWILAGLVLPAPGRPQEPGRRLTNQDIISMTQLGLSDDVIIAKIRTASAAGAEATAFDTSIDGLKALKDAHVSDAVIKVMINPAPPPPVTLSAVSPAVPDPNLPPPEVGVYWKNKANFVLIQGRAIDEAKVGGRAGSYLTYGMRNQHWDAYIEGPTSANVVQERRPFFYFYVPEGNDASDYVLIKLNKKGDRREFQIGSFGGVTGGKSGVKRDKEVAYKAEHVAIRTYRVTLDEDLSPGEYAFFMGTGMMSTMSGAKGGNRSGGAASGRVYDFSVPE
ncbi:MAG TPA: hypothetical protein VEJ45_04195 [Candidatus Acidoferrales bacterium]|nr:hypothetical protein [Candidatus Acidoferrales bacterium]